MKVLPYRTDHASGDVVYLLGKFFKTVNGQPLKVLEWGKPYTVERSYHCKDLEGNMTLVLEIEEYPGVVFDAEQFVSQICWIQIDLAVLNLIYSKN